MVLLSQAKDIHEHVDQQQAFSTLAWVINELENITTSRCLDSKAKSFWSSMDVNITNLQRLVWLVGFLTSSSTTRLYRGRAPRQSIWQFYVLPHMRQSWETMTSVSAGHIILTPTQPVGSGRPQREWNPGPPYQESRALSTELPRPPIYRDLILVADVFTKPKTIC